MAVIRSCGDYQIVRRVGGIGGVVVGGGGTIELMERYLRAGKINENNCSRNALLNCIFVSDSDVLEYMLFFWGGHRTSGIHV